LITSRATGVHSIAEHVHGLPVLGREAVGLRESHRAAVLAGCEHAHAIIIDHCIAVARRDGAQRPPQRAASGFVAVVCGQEAAAMPCPVRGVLSEEGARRLADALSEIEMMNAAYRSCRADAYSTRGQLLPAE
jgi:hypothetical protein